MGERERGREREGEGVRGGGRGRPIGVRIDPTKAAAQERGRGELGVGPARDGRTDGRTVDALHLVLVVLAALPRPRGLGGRRRLRCRRRQLLLRSTDYRWFLVPNPLLGSGKKSADKEDMPPRQR